MTSNPDGSTLAATTQVVAQPTQAEHTEEFQTGKVALIALGHLAHDTYPAFLAPLLPLLTTKLGLSLALAGSLGSFLRLSSVAQPFLGYLADRTNVRLFIILAPACTGILMSALGPGTHLPGFDPPARPDEPELRLLSCPRPGDDHPGQRPAVGQGYVLLHARR